MKKGELIAEFAKRTDMSGVAANTAVNTIIDIITERLKKGDTVGITGFGTFSITKRAARKGRNPSTGEVIKIGASKTPRFFRRRHAQGRRQSKEKEVTAPLPGAAPVVAPAAARPLS